jgi:hypothetical protein
MIGKIPKTGRSFGGCIKYVMLKKDAIILHTDGVRIDKVNHTINDFNMQRKMNPGLGQAVGHIALSWSPNDKDRLNDEIMLGIAEEYLEKMGVKETQVLIVRHAAAKNPHVHIVYNRVDNSGKTISDKLQHRKNVKVCKELTIGYGFYIANDKQEVNRGQLKGSDKVKYEIYDAIKKISSKVTSMDELKQQLLRQGIEMRFKYKIGSSDIQGISFSKNDHLFKGSEIDRSMSYHRLNDTILNNTIQPKEDHVNNYTSEFEPTLQEIGKQHGGHNEGHQKVAKSETMYDDSLKRQPSSLQPDLFTISSNQTQDEDGQYKLSKKKKRKHWPDQNQDMQR